MIQALLILAGFAASAVLARQGSAMARRPGQRVPGATLAACGFTSLVCLFWAVIITAMWTLGTTASVFTNLIFGYRYDGFPADGDPCLAFLRPAQMVLLALAGTVTLVTLAVVARPRLRRPSPQHAPIDAS